MAYSYKKTLDTESKEIINIRHQLVSDRINEVLFQCEVQEKYVEYFKSMAHFLAGVDLIVMSTKNGEYYNYPVDNKKNLQKVVYREILNGAYENSYLNPAVAVAKLGKEYGPVLSAFYAEIYAAADYAYAQDIEQVLIRQELFMELYGCFMDALSDEKEEPELEDIKSIISQFAYDYLDYMLGESLSASFANTESIYKSIVMEANLENSDYLYDYGIPISDVEIRMADFMSTIPQEQIDAMASTYSEGFRKGFVATGKDISIKDTVEIRYFLGFERVARKAVELFEQLGLKAIIHCSTPSFMLGRGVIKRGIDYTNPCKQFDADHEHDKELYFDKKFCERKLEAYRDALEAIKKECSVYAGPAVIECFGEKPFAPAECEAKISLSPATKELLTSYTSRAGQILNTYVKGEERSFTIIAFPTPAIGEDFEDIFKETIKLNTLDYEKYMRLQQIIIDTLDKATSVKVKGMNGNRTEIEVQLVDIIDSNEETKFENCVADVNIPVGEVFTSPKLEGTQGVLHVKEVFLNGIQFVDLSIEFKDGIIDNITCGNYEDEKENKKFIDTYLLFNHKTLPLGEFAIGTNTVAYKVTKDYNLSAIMPILIAEKTGPHFAVGDTCYSHEEEVETFNPDGKRIVAKENRYSKKKEYFNCHTDITIPYDELGYVKACMGDTDIDIIKDGQFVLEGLEELNIPLKGE